MQLFNWGNQTPEEKAVRDRFETDALYEQAARAGRAGQAPGAAGSKQNLTLPTDERTFVVYTSEGDEWSYSAYHYNTDTLNTTSSGVLTANWDYYSINPDAMGYVIVRYGRSNNSRFQYVGPDAKVIYDSGTIDDNDWISDVFTYYNGGISLFIRSQIQNTAKMLYFYAGKKYEYNWIEGVNTFGGINDELASSPTIEGTANFFMDSFSEPGKVEHWMMGPKVPGGVSKRYTTSSTAFAHSLYDSPAFTSEGKFAYNGYKNSNHILIDTDLSGYLVDIVHFTSRLKKKFFEPITNILSSKFSVNAYDRLSLQYYQFIFGEDGLVLQIHDDNTLQSFSFILNCKTGQIVASTSGSYGDYQYALGKDCVLFIDSSINDSNGNFFRFDHASIALTTIYPDGTTITGSIPNVDGAIDRYTAFPMITKDGTAIYSFSYRDTLDRPFDLISLQAKDSEYIMTISSVPNFVLGPSVSSNHSPVANEMYNDVKGEKFMNLYKLPNDIYPVEVDLETVTFTEKGGYVGEKTVLPTAGAQNLYGWGWGFVPSVINVIDYPSNIQKTWCQNYSTYAWEKKIDNSTYDSYVSTYHETYYGGYENMPGSYHLIYVDPDAGNSWIITSKYGVAETGLVPLFEFVPINDDIGQQYTLMADIVGYDLWTVESNSGVKAQLVKFSGDFVYVVDTLNDRVVAISGPGGPGNNKLDLFNGSKKRTITWFDDIDWVHNDMYD